MQYHLQKKKKIKQAYQSSANIYGKFYIMGLLSFHFFWMIATLNNFSQHNRIQETKKSLPKIVWKKNMVYTFIFLFTQTLAVHLKLVSWLLNPVFFFFFFFSLKVTETIGFARSPCRLRAVFQSPKKKIFLVHFTLFCTTTMSSPARLVKLCNSSMYLLLNVPGFPQTALKMDSPRCRQDKKYFRYCWFPL